MSLSIHPKAIANFNKKGEEILSLLANARGPNRETSFPSQLFVEHFINAQEIIGEMKYGEADFKGDEISRYFKHEGKLVGLNGDNYIAFEHICTSIQRSPSLRDVISLKAIKDAVFEWVKHRHKAQTNQPLLDFILPRIESVIKEIEIWIPIFGTEIESSFSVGRVLFQTISKSMIDKWSAEVIKGKPDEEAKKLKKYFDKERRQIQGLAAGTMVLKADPVRAGEIAIDEIERMLNLVRFFEPSNFHPSISSHCTILGKQNLQTTKFYTVENGMLVGSSSTIIDKSSSNWRIDNNLLAIMKHDGLDKINSLLVSEKPSEFQKLVIDTLQTYSRSGLAKTYSDKLVYLLVTLESLLLKDNSESIQQNVGERLAFALEKEPENRKRIVKNFKEIYGMRSEFVHHGNDVDIEQVNTLREFMMNTWRFLRLVINNANNFQTKIQMINAIENIKFT
jgi:hypothetical protein